MNDLNPSFSLPVGRLPHERVRRPWSAGVGDNQDHCDSLACIARSVC